MRASGATYLWGFGMVAGYGSYEDFQKSTTSEGLGNCHGSDGVWFPKQ